MLTSKERAQLRAQANPLETTLMVGKDGVTEAVAAEADRLLTAHELHHNVDFRIIQYILRVIRQQRRRNCP